MLEFSFYFTVIHKHLEKILVFLLVLCVGVICIYESNLLSFHSNVLATKPQHKVASCNTTVGHVNNTTIPSCIMQTISLVPRTSTKTIAKLCEILCRTIFNGTILNSSRLNDIKTKLLRSCVHHDSSVGSLLTLFSTWPDGDHHTVVRNNTCYNWASLMPLVQPVLFTNNARAANACSKRGWKILPVGLTAAGGSPVLKYMFLDVRKKVKSLYYGFANGDILFTEDLLQTLIAIFSSSVPTEQKFPFIVGIRTNVNGVTFAEARSYKSLKTISKQRGKLFVPTSGDYFITDANYPWRDIPALVIGRRGYDNWLVFNALRHRNSVIDVTRTVLAVHQTTRIGNSEGNSRINPSYNIDLLSRLYHFKSIQYYAGATTCIPMITTFSLNGNVLISKRTGFSTYCALQPTND